MYVCRFTWMRVCRYIYTNTIQTLIYNLFLEQICILTNEKLFFFKIKITHCPIMSCIKNILIHGCV